MAFFLRSKALRLSWMSSSIRWLMAWASLCRWILRARSSGDSLGGGRRALLSGSSASVKGKEEAMVADGRGRESAGGRGHGRGDQQCDGLR